MEKIEILNENKTNVINALIESTKCNEIIWLKSKTALATYYVKLESATIEISESFGDGYINMSIDNNNDVDILFEENNFNIIRTLFKCVIKQYNYQKEINLLIDVLKELKYNDKLNLNP